MRLSLERAIVISSLLCVLALASSQALSAQTSGVWPPGGSGGGGGAGGNAASATYTVSTAYFFPLTGGSLVPSTTQANVQTAFAKAGAMSAMAIKLVPSPTGSNTVVFVLDDGATDESVTCTVTSTTNPCTDPTNSFSYLAGDSLSIKMTPTGANYTGTVQITIGTGQSGPPGTPGTAGAQGASGIAIACSGTPGSTVAGYRVQCIDTNNVVWACKNSGGCSVAADWTQVTGLPDPGASGILVRTGLFSVITRSLAAGSGQIIITNPTGVAGNPTIDIGTLTANAPTATALAGTPLLCPTGQAPTGIAANGNATGCAAIGGGGSGGSGNYIKVNTAYSSCTTCSVTIAGINDTNPLCQVYDSANCIAGSTGGSCIATNMSNGIASGTNIFSFTLSPLASSGVVSCIGIAANTALSLASLTNTQLASLTNTTLATLTN